MYLPISEAIIIVNNGIKVKMIVHLSYEIRLNTECPNSADTMKTFTKKRINRRSTNRLKSLHLS